MRWQDEVEEIINPVDYEHMTASELADGSAAKAAILHRLAGALVEALEWLEDVHASMMERWNCADCPAATPDTEVHVPFVHLERTGWTDHDEPTAGPGARLSQGECLMHQRTETLLSIAAVAELLGVSADTVRRMQAAGYIRAVVLPSGHRRFRPAEVARVRRELGYDERPDTTGKEA
jgi:excisionase family DNA binding protein